MSLSQRSSDVKKREAQVMEYLRAGKSPTDIALEMGYASDSAIHGIRNRVINRQINQDTQAYQAMELDRTDALLETLWPKARRGDLHAIDRVMRVLERRAKYLGLDFSDALAERQVQLNEQLADLFLKGMEIVFKQLELTDTQRALVPAAVQASLIELAALEHGGNTEAVDTVVIPEDEPIALD